MGSRPQQDRDDSVHYAPANRVGAPSPGPDAFQASGGLPPGGESRNWPPDSSLPAVLPPPASAPGRPLFGGLPPLGIAAAIGLVLLLCVCGSVFWLLNRGNNPPAAPTPLLSGSGTAGVPPASSGDLTAAAFRYDSLVTASAIDSSGRATNTTPVFTSTATIYTVLPIYNVVTGTTFFARWRHEDQIYDDSAAITAPQAWAYNFAEFHMQSLPQKPFPKGNYTVQIYIDGLPGPTARFVVQ